MILMILEQFLKKLDKKMTLMTEKNLEKLKTKKAIRSRSPNKKRQKQTKSLDIQKPISLQSKRKEFPKRPKTQKPKEKEKMATRKGKKERNDIFVVS